MFIRILTPQDQPQISRLAEIATTRANRQPEGGQAEWSANWGEQEGDLGVGYDQHGLKGACWIRTLPGDTGEKEHRMVIAVDRPQRGQGVGGALLKELLAQAEQAGIEEINLSVREENQAARSLYSKAGFRETGLDSQGRIAMVRSL